MTWGSIGNFFYMGGYGPYVWSSYGMCFGLIVIEILVLRARRRRAVTEAKIAAKIAAQREAV
jgi:heme exporter protein D